MALFISIVLAHYFVACLQAENRQVRRLMEKDNLKERERGKRYARPFPPQPMAFAESRVQLPRELTSFAIFFGVCSDYHELVRNLVAHVKKRDPRVAEHNAKSKEEAAERAVRTLPVLSIRGLLSQPPGLEGV